MSYLNKEYCITGTEYLFLKPVLEIIIEVACKFNFEFLVIGATARDFLIKYVFESDINIHATRDLDFAILIDDWGKGINKIIEACQSDNLPLPEFIEDFGGLQVTLYKDIYNEPYLKKLGLNSRQMEGIKYLKTNDSITNREYRELTGVKDRTALDDLKKMMSLDLIDKSGDTGRGTYYFLKTRNKPAKPTINPQ
jgi:hypothetical protein